MLLLSANFGEELSIAWMKCCLIAFVHDTLLAQTLKTSLVYLFLVLLDDPLGKKRIFSVCAKGIFKLVLA